ncbi:uncharacterized protein Cht6 isoform X7 [Lepeophtheirus salmonis]|uniref:uncharacterized protein Cht6 isoform X7 n=1 Tax=Lepeophtheirus salmonis TaxID=72036 RepID=UPI003AF34524
MSLVKNKILPTLIVVLVCLSISSGTKLVKRQVDNQKKVVCYYANWAVYRQGQAKFSPQNINPYLCTHLIYAFGGLKKDDTIAPFDKYQDLEKRGLSHFASLKTYNKELKTMVAIGGWNEASKKFSPMVADPERRYTFIKSAVQFLRRYNFDGIDLDWEYPTQRDGGRPQDKENYAKLIKEMREAFEREADQTGKDRLIISMAVPASLEITAEGYDVRALDKDLDFFNVLAYDYHSSLETAVNHHSPLFRIKEISEFDFRTDLNIESTIKYYLGHGASPNKLVLGIPTYGRSYTLVNPDAHEIGSPTDGPGVKGNGTKEDGYLAYYEICKGIKEQKWDVVRANPGQTGPYAHHDNFWVGYDDIDIVREKAYYVAEEGLGGIMFWTIDNDDFRGNCHNEPYPLIEAAKRALYSSTTSVQSSRSDRPRSLSNNRGVTTPSPPTTPSSEPSFVCTDEGFFPHTKSCKKYYWCLEAAGVGMVAHTFTCPQGLFFNSLTDGCDFKRNVECGDKSTKEEVKVEDTTTESSVASKSNDKSVQDILQEIKSAGGLAAFEEQLQEEEFEKKELKQRTKDRNDDISSKTRNRFTKLLERKKPKESEPTSSESSYSQEKKEPSSFLTRLSNRRRNNDPPSSTSSPIITESPSTTPITSSPISNPPARSGFLRNRNRPTFLRNQPPQPEENIPAEDNEIVLPETPRNSLVQDPLKNVQRTSFLNRGTPPQSENISGLGKAEPVKISSDSFRPKTFVRNEEEEEELEVIKIDDQTPDLITEGTPTLLQRSRDSERNFKFSSVQNRGLPPRLTKSSATDFSRNLAYVTIDRSRGTPKLSDDTEPVIPSQGRESAAPSTTLVEEEAPRDRENTVRDLEYVTIQRGVPSRKKLQSQVIDRKPLDDEESVEDAGSLQGRLLQRLQQRKIKTQKNRNTLFKTSRRPSFIRPRKPVTTESSVLTPTIINTPEEEEIIINDEHVLITTNTVATTEIVTTQSASTSRPHQKLRPINLSSPSSVNEVDPLQNEFETSSTKSFFNPTSPSRNRFRPQVNQSPAPNTSPSPIRNRFQPQDVSSPPSPIRNRFRTRNQSPLSRPLSSRRRLQPKGQFPAPDSSNPSSTQNLVINEDQPTSSRLSTPFQNRIQLQNQSPAHKPSTHIPSRVQLQDQPPKHRSETTFAFENRIKLQEQSLDSNDSPSPKDNKPLIRGQFPALRPSTPSPFQNRFQIEDQSPEPTPTPSLEEIKSLNPDQSPIPTPSTPTPLQNNFLPQDQSPAPRLSTPSPLQNNFQPRDPSFFPRPSFPPQDPSLDVPETSPSPFKIIIQPEDQSPNNPNISLSRSRLQLQLQSPDAPETSPSRGKFQPHEQFFDTSEPSPSPLNNRFRQVEQSSDRPANTQYPTRSRFQPQGQSPDTPETSRYPSRSRFQPQEQSLETPPTSPSPLKSRFQPLEQSSDTPETSSSGSLFQEQSTDLPTTSTSTVRNVFQPQEQSSDEPETPSLRSRLKPQEQSIDTSSTPPSPSNNRFQSHEQSSDTPKTSPSGNGLPSQEQPQDSPKTSFSRNRFQSRNRSPDSSLSRNRFQSRNRSPKVPEISQEARTNIFQQQPRRLDVFRNRFQVSPSSPRPIVSKSKEEELFSDVQQQQNTLPISDDKESSQSNSDFPRDSITTASTTTDPPARSTLQFTRTTPSATTSKPRSIVTSPARRFPPSSTPTRNAASRSRSKSINRSRTRSRPTTTTTTPAPEYDYYYDEEYPGEKNGIGKLKSVDPIYDYDLTPLTEKVAITSEGVVCYDVGVFPHPGSCKKFITCSRRTSVGRIVGWEYECPIYLAFDSIGGRCNWASEVDCS